MILKVNVLRLLYRRPTGDCTENAEWMDFCSKYRCVRGLRWLGTPRAGRRGLGKRAVVTVLNSQDKEVMWSEQVPLPILRAFSVPHLWSVRQDRPFPKAKPATFPAAPWIHRIPYHRALEWDRQWNDCPPPQPLPFLLPSSTLEGGFCHSPGQCSTGFESIPGYRSVPPEQGQLKPLVLKTNKSKLLRKVTSPCWRRAI